MCAATMMPTEPSTRAQFLDDDGVLDVAEPGAAQLLREDRAHVAELAEFANDFEREDLRFVPLHDVGRDFGLGEFADGLAQLELFGRVVEIHMPVHREATLSGHCGYTISSLTGSQRTVRPWR